MLHKNPAGRAMLWPTHGALFFAAKKRAEALGLLSDRVTKLPHAEAIALLDRVGPARETYTKAHFLRQTLGIYLGEVRPDLPIPEYRGGLAEAREGAKFHENLISRRPWAHEMHPYVFAKGPSH